MSTKLEKRAEKISQLLTKLTDETEKGTPIVVEGQNDVTALNEIGVEADFICAKSSGKSFLDILTEVESRGKHEVILLMDFDRRGRELTHRLTRDLERMGINPNLLFWRQLFGLAGRDIKDIEGLGTYMKNLNTRSRKYCSPKS